MTRTFTLIFCCIITLNSVAQGNQGFTSITNLTPLKISSNTEEKPQSKIWKHACTYWTVLPDSTGTHIWRLDGTSWTKAFTISTRTIGKADCKVVDDVVHIFLFRGGSTSELVSVEYDPELKTYIPWSERNSSVPIQRLRGTATIDIDSKGKMWLASTEINDVSKINVWWSDYPYTKWSSPITLATGINADDIGGVITMPGKIGVFWSNQNTRRFGFKTHTDGDDPTKWSEDEIPASQSALNIGLGMADDHINMAIAKDGTLYCAVKTNYDKKNHPRIALLVRRPSGAWDNLHGISETGTRPIVILNEELGNIKVLYTSIEGGGDILYNESSVDNILFGPKITLLKGTYNDASSSKENYTSDIVVLASNKTHATGVLLSNNKGSLHIACADDIGRSFVAYPNPFSERTALYFTLKRGGEYEITMYDMKGSHIATLEQGKAEAYELNTVQINSNWLPRGLYLIKLQAPGVTKSLKLVHVK